MDYEETIDRFRKGSLEIDCRSMMLIQRVENGEIYRGKGYIRQTEDGALEFKLYVVNTDRVKPFESLTRRLGIAAGKVHPDDVFYDLEAVAHDGTQWSAKRIQASFSWDYKDVEALGYGLILSIKSATDSQQEFSPFLQLHFFDDIEVPFTEMGETERWGERYMTRDRAEFHGSGAKWKVRKRDGRLIFDADSVDKAFPEHFEYRVQEAVQLLAAKPVFWRARLAGNAKKVELELVSPWRRPIRSQMSVPIARGSEGYFNKGWGLFLLYLDYLVASTKDTHWNRLAYHLYNASEASANSVDAWAVGYCVALEALTSFITLEDNGDHRARIEAFQKKARTWLAAQIDDADVAPRLEGMISGLATERPADKLHVLAKSGRVTEAYIKSWTKLRNKHLHPRPADLGKPDAAYMQEMLDLIHQVEVVIFQIVFSIIGYEGPFTDYGVKGFPTRQYPLSVPQPADDVAASV